MVAEFSLESFMGLVITILVVVIHQYEQSATEKAIGGCRKHGQAAGPLREKPTVKGSRNSSNIAGPKIHSILFLYSFQKLGH